jgi:hypothetical protein
MDAFLSRKFIVSVVGAAVIALNEKLGLSLDPEVVIAFGSIIIAYVTGQAVVDKNKVQAEVAASVSQLKTEANAIISALTAKLESLQGDAPDA